jgi:RecJ-like exonuclease
MRGDYDSFCKQAKKVGDFVLSMDNPLLVHHYDADGLSSGGLVANALTRAGRKFGRLVLKKIDDDGLKRAFDLLSTGGHGGIVFVDLGSGQNAMLEEVFVAKGVMTVVIDHHVPQKQIDSPLYLQANCMDFGFEGGTDASAASTAYYCFRHKAGNEDLVQLAIVGAVGDIQDSSGLIELNRVLVEGGAASGIVQIKKDLKLFGRVSRSLVGFLCYASEPFMPGLTGDEKACALFLDDNGIPIRGPNGEWFHYNDLPAEVQKKLASAIILHLLSKGVAQEAVAELAGEVYEFPHAPPHSVLYDAHEYSTLLNACGRHEQVQVGIDVTMNVPGALERAETVLRLHRTMISKGISFAKKNTSDLGAFYFLDAKGKVEDSIIGTVIGSYFNSGVVERTKPILGFSLDEKGNVKASGRANKTLVAAGTDLNALMRESAKAAGGLGGGHKIAAGASFPPGGEDVFLRKAAEIAKSQLH